MNGICFWNPFDFKNWALGVDTFPKSIWIYVGPITISIRRWRHT